MSNTPFYEYKVQTYEGGISTPFIAHWPKHIDDMKGAITHEKGYLIDVMPTILEVAGATYPKIFHEGNKIYPLEGKSLVPVLMNGEREDHEYMYWEHQNNCAIRKGDWKMVKKLNTETWELYDLSKDRQEANDLAEYPDLVKEMGLKWQEWANSHFVLPKKLSK